jgi:peptidoglycan/xylan/chitin deacetylase (PgdA/CDA1 family)
LSNAYVARVLTRLRRDRCVIVMMHRFAGLHGASHGHLPELLRETLAHFRAAGVQLLDLDEAVASYADPARVREGRPPAVAFTVDDGYRDFLSVGVPVFAEFDCPVTCFVVPDVIDGKSWFWWDQLDWLLQRTPWRTLTLELSGAPVTLENDPFDPADDWRERLADRLKASPEAARMQFLDDVAATIGERYPAKAPSSYQVMGWDALRAAERRGVRFGAHSMSHPVLSQCDDDRARYEIVESVRRVQGELANPSSVFCYPYGRTGEFLARDGAFVAEAGLEYAVCAINGRLTGHFAAATGAGWQWRIPRVAFENRSGVIARQLYF